MFEHDADRRKVGGALQGHLQGQQLFLAVGFAGLDAAIETPDQIFRIALETADLQLAEAVARTACGHDRQVDPARFGIDFGAALLQARSCVINCQQLGQQSLLGLVPVGLPEGLAGGQFPGTQQRLPSLGVEIADDFDVYAADQRARAGKHRQQQFVAVLAQHDVR